MKRINTITLFASAVTALALVGNGHAANPGTAGAEASKTQPRSGKTEAVGERSALPTADQSFLQKSAEMNLSEIELGRIAERASTNPELKRLAQDIVRNHTAANQQLQKLAASKGVTLPSTPNKAQQQKIASMESKSGAAFDKAFMQEQIQNAQQAISTYEKEGNRTADADIKAWANSMVPRLKDRLATLRTNQPEIVGEKTQKASPSSKKGSSTPSSQRSGNPTD